jgi:hypothetical protein
MQKDVVLPKDDRVRIWNSFFKLAWLEAKQVFELSNNSICEDTFDPLGGTLREDEFHILAALVLCCLSIEARANHLIDELHEHNKISAEIADAARYLPTKEKWFFLPTIAGIVPNPLRSDKQPHQAIKQLCDYRNALMHVKYKELRKKMPSAKQLISYFDNFVKAMEDMNVALKRHSKPDPKILKIGHFPSKSIKP